MHLTVPVCIYCHSGPVNSNNSILTKLSVMPFCHGRQLLKKTKTKTKTKKALHSVR